MQVNYRFSIEAFPLSEETEAALEGADQRARVRQDQADDPFRRHAARGEALRRQSEPAIHHRRRERQFRRASIKGLEALADVVEPGRKVIVIGTINDVPGLSPPDQPGRQRISGRPGHDGRHRGGDRELRQGRQHRHRKGRVISFIGSRGGVGSSTAGPPMSPGRLADTARKKSSASISIFNFGTMALSLNLDPKQPVFEAPDRCRTVSTPVLVERFLTEHGAAFIRSVDHRLAEGYRPNRRPKRSSG